MSAADTATISAIQIAMMRATAPQMRGQHPKMHGCVEATVTICAPAPYDQGIFANGGSYPAKIRFSNGREKDDRTPDLHGMAIKIMGIAGQKALEHSPDGEADIILADNPKFFIRTSADYAIFFQSLAKNAPLGKPPIEFIQHLQATGKAADIAVMQAINTQVQSNPLTATYWSQVPYALGTETGVACRYRAIPKAGHEAGSPGPRKDYLRESMVARLAPGAEAVVYLLQVQRKTDATEDVIDNPTVEWEEDFVTVAEISIPAQTFDTQAQIDAGQALHYNPWHALVENKPIGQVNEIRRAVYPASQAERDKIAPVGQENLRLSDAELRAGIDDDFKSLIDKLSRTFGYLSHTKRGRGTHTWGAAGYGTARFIVDPEFLANDFFVFGKECPVIIRHSSPGAREDDRARDGMAGSVKFFPEGGGYNGAGVLDILMNAGRQLFVRSIQDFSTFVHASDDERKAFTQKGIMMEPELIEAYRIRGSFLDSRYHSWQCFEFFDSAGVQSYIKFRLIPGDRGPERGLPKPDFRADGAPSMDPLPSDPRAPDFLRQDWIYQVQNSVVRYILQGQIHAMPADMHPDHEVLNPARAWNEVRMPWRDLCEITIDEPILDNDVVSGLDMTPNRSPECIKIPLATSPTQFASLGHARALIYPGARAVRAAAEQPQNN